MTTPEYCPNCGAELPPGAQFCPRCGQTVVVAAEPARVVPDRASRWWVIAIPIGIIAVALIAWAILAGMPYGSQRSQVQTLPGADTANTIGENAQTTETVSQIGGTTTTIDRGPVAVPSTQPPLQPAPIQPAPIIVQQQTPPPMTTSPAAPAPTPPMASASTAPQPTEISEDDAVSRLRDFLARNNPYSTSADCIGLATLGERNHGYTIDVRDTCASTPNTLGRWRADAVTGEVYRQNDDGRYVKP